MEIAAEETVVILPLTRAVSLVWSVMEIGASQLLTRPSQYFE